MGGADQGLGPILSNIVIQATIGHPGRWE